MALRGPARPCEALRGLRLRNEPGAGAQETQRQGRARAIAIPFHLKQPSFASLITPSCLSSVVITIGCAILFSCFFPDSNTSLSSLHQLEIFLFQHYHQESLIYFLVFLIQYLTLICFYLETYFLFFFLTTTHHVVHLHLRCRYGRQRRHGCSHNLSRCQQLHHARLFLQVPGQAVLGYRRRQEHPHEARRG